MRASGLLLIAFCGVLAACAKVEAGSQPPPPQQQAVAVPDGAVILPEAAGKDLLHQCSRGTPEPGEGTWRPAAADIAAVEAALHPALLADRRAKELVGHDGARDWRRQYVGLVRHGERFIYGNVFPAEAGGDSWRTRAVIVCDGGPAFFGVEYDVAHGRITRLDFNGVA